MRVYISGAISGIDDFKEHFARAEEHLMEVGYSVINPAKIDSVLPDDFGYEEHMRLDIVMLDMCDSVYMLSGWEKSCGANREYGYALAKDKTVMFESVESENRWYNA